MTPEETLKRAVHEYAFDIALRYVRERLDEMPSDPEGWHDVLTAVREYAASDEAIFGKAEKRRELLRAKAEVFDELREAGSALDEHDAKSYEPECSVCQALAVLRKLETP